MFKYHRHTGGISQTHQLCSWVTCSTAGLFQGNFILKTDPRSNQSVRNRSEETHVSQLTVTIEAMEPQDIGVAPGISCWEREGHKLEGDLVSLISNSSSNFSTTLED